MSTNNINFYGSSSSRGFEDWIETRLKEENEKLIINIEILNDLIEQLVERLNNQEKIINELKLTFLPNPQDILFYEKVYAENNPMNQVEIFTQATLDPYDIDADPKPSSNADAATSTP